MLSVALLLAGLGGGLPAPAPLHSAAILALHAALESTEPAAGDTITAYPGVIRLLFSEPIEDEFSAITLRDGTGNITKIESRVDPRDVSALIAPFPRLAPGGYLVSWRVVSADGHPIGGYFQFYAAVEDPPGRSKTEILQGTPPAPAPPTETPAGGPIGPSGEPPVLSAIVRGTAQVLLLSIAGLLVLLTWGGPERSGRLARVERMLVLAAPVLLAADFLLWLQHAAPGGSVGIDSITEAMGTQNGAGYALRVGFSLGAAWALILARSPGVAAVFAMLALVASGATGHPAAISPSVAIPVKIVHLVAVALWTGGLVVLAVGERTEAYRKDAWRVSSIALVAVIAVALTGAIETWLFLPRLGDLFRSTYGWLIIAKLVGLGVLVAIGWRNRYRIMPHLEQAGPAALQRSVSWETGWMAAVVVLAAFLAYIPPPPAEGMAMPVTHHHEVEGQE